MIRIILFGLALSGFTPFAYEIYWTRSLVFILGNSTYALTTMLSSFLTGIALGGYLIRFFFKRVKDGCALFGWIQVLLGIFSALALPILFSISDPQALSRYILTSSEQISSFVFAGFGVAFLVMLVPAMLIGATFPLAGHIGVMDVNRTGTSIGKIYAINSLDHPRYEFYYPWDYAVEKQNKFITNHQFITKLRHAANADFLAGLEAEIPNSSKLKATFGAENIYLSTFEKYLKGMNSVTLYSMFDYILSLAPWNDSLRARIYSLYAYAASVPRDPFERARLMKRANLLYKTGHCCPVN